MTQLASLTAFIENNLPARARIPFTSDMDDITLVPFTKSLGHGSYVRRSENIRLFCDGTHGPIVSSIRIWCFLWLKPGWQTTAATCASAWHRMRQPLTSKWMMKMKWHGWKSVCRWLIPSPWLRTKTAPSPEAGNVTSWKSLKSGWLRRISFTVR